MPAVKKFLEKLKEDCCCCRDEEGNMTLRYYLHYEALCAERQSEEAVKGTLRHVSSMLSTKHLSIYLLMPHYHSSTKAMLVSAENYVEK